MSATCDDLTKKAAELIQSKNYSDALRLCDQAILTLPKNSEFFLIKADVLRLMEKYEESIYVYKKVCELNPENSVALNNLAICMRKLGKFDEALIYNSKAITMDPNNTYFLSSKAICLLYLGKLTEALEISDKISTATEKNTEILINHSEIVKAMGKYKEALNFIERSIKLDAKEPQFHLLKGEIYTMLEIYDEAVKFYSKSIEIMSEYTLAYVYRAYGYLQTEQFELLKNDISQIRKLVEKDKYQGIPKKSQENLLTACKELTSVENMLEIIKNKLSEKPELNEKPNENLIANSTNLLMRIFSELSFFEIHLTIESQKLKNETNITLIKNFYNNSNSRLALFKKTLENLSLSFDKNDISKIKENIEKLVKVISQLDAEIIPLKRNSKKCEEINLKIASDIGLSQPDFSKLLKYIQPKLIEITNKIKAEYSLILYDRFSNEPIYRIFSEQLYFIICSYFYAANFFVEFSPIPAKNIDSRLIQIFANLLASNCEYGFISQIIDELINYEKANKFDPILFETKIAKVNSYIGEAEKKVGRPFYEIVSRTVLSIQGMRDAFINDLFSGQTQERESIRELALSKIVALPKNVKHPARDVRDLAIEDAVLLIRFLIRHTENDLISGNYLNTEPIKFSIMINMKPQEVPYVGTPGCCILFKITEIIYSNPLLNQLDFLSELSRKTGQKLSKIIDYSDKNIKKF